LTKAEVGNYLQRHGAALELLEGDVPEDLARRVRRLWVLLLRAKLERMTEEVQFIGR
jgi:hypothetical protein